jgi:hypothetical protein
MKNGTCDSKTVLLLVFALPSNGLRYLRWGGGGEAVQTEKTNSVEKCLKMAPNPQRRVHALLEGFAQDSLIESQNHRHKTDKIIARTLLFSKNQKMTCVSTGSTTTKMPRN